MSVVLKYLVGVMLTLSCCALIAAPDQKKSDTPSAKPPKTSFIPNAALDADALRRQQELDFTERAAAEVAIKLAKAEAANDASAEQLRRELDRLAGSLFEQQQRLYRLENDQLRARIAAVDRALSKRDESQREVIAAKVKALLKTAAETKATAKKPLDGEAQQRDLFRLVLEAVRVQQRIRELQFQPGTVVTGLADMSAFRQEYGRTVRIEVEGRDSGPVWGTDVYSDDSDIATAAVHAGLLAIGEKGVLQVKIVPTPPAGFTAATRHGITSREFSNWASGYTLEKVDEKSLPQDASTAHFSQNWGNRGQLGDQFYFELTGRTTEQIWGTDVYTLDSDRATAAVHAGVLTPGETGWVCITIVKSPHRHEASTQHGVTSDEFGIWPASFIVTKARGKGSGDRVQGSAAPSSK